MKEEWKNISEYEGYYQASSQGRIRSLDRLIHCRNGKSLFWRGKILKLNKNKEGYLRVRLAKTGKVKTHLVNRLIAQTFLKNYKDLPEVNHKNTIKTDNRVINLEWISHKNHGKHRIKFNQIARHEKHGKSKLTKTQVIEIRKKYIPWKHGCHKLSKEYNVSRSSIFNILKQKHWKNLTN